MAARQAAARKALLWQRFGCRVLAAHHPTSQLIPPSRWVIFVQARAWLPQLEWLALLEPAPVLLSAEAWSPPRPGSLLEPASVAAIDVNRGLRRVRAAAAATVIMATISAGVRSSGEDGVATLLTKET